jgi:hypothetical protein
LAPPKKATKKSPTRLLVNLDDKRYRIFGAILSLRGESIGDVLRKAVDDYIAEYKSILGVSLEELEKDDNDKK